MKKNIISFKKLFQTLRMYLILAVLFLLTTLLFLHEIIWKICRKLIDKLKNETTLKPIQRTTYSSNSHFTHVTPTNPVYE